MIELTAADIARALGGRKTGEGWSCKCPAHDDNSPSLSIRQGDSGQVLVKCHAGCDQADVLDALRARGLWTGRGERRDRTSPAVRQRERPEPSDSGRDKAAFLWGRRQPIRGTAAEAYLREARRITCPLPPTLGFLPARGDYPPAMIAAFGMVDEPGPGVIAIADSTVRAVHLTRLLPDGSGKAEEPAKIMVAPSLGQPIVLAAMNDLLGLAITEGIEDALSIHSATGLGAWAAGSASRLAALADVVPAWTDCVSIFADPDPAGTSNTLRLAEALAARGIAVDIVPLAEVPR